MGASGTTDIVQQIRVRATAEGQRDLEQLRDTLKQVASQTQTNQQATKRGPDEAEAAFGKLAKQLRLLQADYAATGMSADAFNKKLRAIQDRSLELRQTSIMSGKAISDYGLIARASGIELDHLGTNTAKTGLAALGAGGSMQRLQNTIAGVAAQALGTSGRFNTLIGNFLQFAAGPGAIGTAVILATAAIAKGIEWIGRASEEAKKKIADLAKEHRDWIAGLNKLGGTAAGLFMPKEGEETNIIEQQSALEAQLRRAIGRRAVLRDMQGEKGTVVELAETQKEIEATQTLLGLVNQKIGAGKEALKIATAEVQLRQQERLQEQRDQIASVTREREAAAKGELATLVKLGEQNELSAGQADRVAKLQQEALALAARVRKETIDASAAKEARLKAEIGLLESAKTVDQQRLANLRELLAVQQELTKQLREQAPLEAAAAAAGAVGNPVTRFDFTGFRRAAFTPPAFGGRGPGAHRFPTEFGADGRFNTGGRISPDLLPQARFTAPTFGASANRMLAAGEIDQIKKAEQLHKLAQRYSLQTAETAARAFESIATAATSGMGNLKESIVGGFTSILQELAMKKAAMGIASGAGAGPWGWVAAGIGVAGSILGGLLGRHKQEQPVRITGVDAAAAAAMQPPEPPPPIVNVRVYGVDGRDMTELVQVELKRNEARDKIVRLPGVAILGAR
jgi:hypothetical protein